jgi:SAM-dependent methyltransferase
MAHDDDSQGHPESAHPGGHPAEGDPGGGHPGGGHPEGHPGGHGPGHPGAPDASHPRAVFHRQYAGGAAPWDTGEPQPEMVALEHAGTFGPRVLDVGCGTGALSLFMASRGHEVLGVDAVDAAIEQARAKASERGLDAGFVVGDVLPMLPDLGERFDAVVDVGFFHSLTDEQREGFARVLASVLEPGGIYAMLCFSDRVPGAFGPRRVSEAEIRATFSDSEFRVREVRPAELHTAVAERPVIDANLAVVERF